METKQTMWKPEENCLKERYVSCVRINGVPILPPLITPEKGAAIKYYRKQAMKVEKQILERKKARAIRQPQYYIPATPKVHTVDQTKFTENILDCCRNIETFLSSTYNIESTDIEAQKHAPKLTCDIQASQYINNELVLFDSQNNGATNSSLCKNVDIDMYQRNGSTETSPNASFSKNNDLQSLSLSRKEVLKKPCVNEIKMLELQQFSTNSSFSRNESFDKTCIKEIKTRNVHNLNLSQNESFDEPRNNTIKKHDLTSSRNEPFHKPWLDEIEKLASPHEATAISKASNNKPPISEIKKNARTIEKPQLIRSNSYILENPSPVLMEHLKKTKNTPRCWSSSENIFNSSKIMPNNDCDVNPPNQELIVDLKSFSDHGKLPDEDLDVTKAESASIFDTSCTETELKNFSDNESQSNISESEYKLKQFIDNNVPQTGGEKDIINVLEKCNETIIINDEKNSSKNEVTCESVDSLKDILKNIPEKYSKQILDYLDKHKKSHVRNDADIVEDFGIPQTFSTPNEERDNSILPTTPNQTVYYSVDDDSKISDYLYKASQELQISKEYQTAQELQYTSLLIYESDKKIVTHKNEMAVDENSARYEKAASIIGAAVKGYLTRRLLHTEKVQNLIDVLKEVLVCAVQLQSENLDCIDEYDVELHRRLIQQVSAACYAFHDIFFNTPIAEQMSIIAMDRQKKIEKLRRPLSNLSVTSAKSTPRKSTKASFSSRSMSAF